MGVYKISPWNVLLAEDMLWIVALLASPRTSLAYYNKQGMVSIYANVLDFLGTPTIISKRTELQLGFVLRRPG